MPSFKVQAARAVSAASAKRGLVAIYDSAHRYPYRLYNVPIAGQPLVNANSDKGAGGQSQCPRRSRLIRRGLALRILLLDSRLDFAGLILLSTGGYGAKGNS